MAKKRRRRTRRNTSDIESRIVDVSQANPHVKLCVYGRNGKGKTRFAATAPKVLIIDINEKGTMSARRFKGVKVFHAKNWTDVVRVYWYLQKGDHDFESVALDTVTQMNSMCLSHVMKEGADRDPTRDPKMPDRRMWGKTAELMKEMLHYYRNLPMNVIFVAQERTTGDPEEGEPLISTVDLPGGSRGVALGAVQVVGRIYRRQSKKGKQKGKWETRMFVGDHESYDTKDRTLVLPRIIRQPTVPKIIKAATSGKEE